ncbi:sensor histidine kinase [Dongia rigui]|uniref:histidine kinase n=1 Tax=Dongia rigui TaxID=940149 RepID=A0ABU5DUG6_9PROT|nr:histidine kinase dimerization/phosphoacceptor domain -containing protein [Dongia rigui]MDY0870939.1 histidine kinase dimerization/phosphoacceptor domain -containing protein [Dongia rigui]
MTPRPHILYIDDDPGICRLVARELARHDIDTTVAHSGNDGLRLAAESAFEVVGLDHFMPGENGLEILAALTGLPHAPSVIYVTGSEDINIAVAALKSGASDFVVKDLQGSFLALLRKAIGTAVLQAQLRRAKEQAEAEMRAANERLERLTAKQSILLHEMNHRIGNSLQLITSMIRLQASSTQDAHAKDVLRQAAERVIAVAQVHQRLYTSDDIQHVQMRPYLTRLLEDQQLAAQDRGCNLAIDIDDVKLPTDRAISVGVIVTELVINALKYAYPDEGGPIVVKLAPIGDNKLVLSVEDEGVGQTGPAQSAKGTGVGSRIVDAMSRSLGADLQQSGDHGGFRSTLTFPHLLEQRREEAHAQ